MEHDAGLVQPLAAFGIVVFFGADGGDAGALAEERVRHEARLVLLQLLRHQTGADLVAGNDLDRWRLALRQVHLFAHVFLLEVGSLLLLPALLPVESHFLRLLQRSLPYRVVAALQQAQLLGSHLLFGLLLDPALVLVAPVASELVVHFVEAEYFAIVFHEFLREGAAGVELAASVDQEGPFCLVDVAHDEVLDQL